MVNDSPRFFLSKNGAICYYQIEEGKRRDGLLTCERDYVDWRLQEMGVEDINEAYYRYDDAVIALLVIGKESV